MTFQEFSRINRERCESPTGFNHRLDSWSTSDWFLAVFGELGEAANIAKKLNRVRDGIPGNKETPEALRAKLRRELGDAFVYLDLLAQSLHENIGDCGIEVFNAKSEELGCSIRMSRTDPPVSEGKPRDFFGELSQKIGPMVSEADALGAVSEGTTPDREEFTL